MANEDEHEEVYKALGVRFLLLITGQFQWLRLKKYAACDEERKCYVAAFRALTEQDDALARLAGHCGIMIVTPEERHASEAVLKLICDEIDWDRYANTPHAHHTRSFLACFAINALAAYHDPERAIKWCDRIVGPCLDQGQSDWRLADSRNILEACYRILKEHEGKQEAGEFAARVVKAVRANHGYQPGPKEVALTRVE